MPTWFRHHDYKDYGGTCGEGDVEGGAQTLLGFGGFIGNTFNLALGVSFMDEGYPIYLPALSGLWFATNFASVGYEVYRNEMEKLRWRVVEII